MLRPKSLSGLAVAVAVASVFATWGTAGASFSFTVTGGPPGPGCSEACSATATITPGAGTLTVVLTDTQADPRSAGDLLSGIEITPSGPLGTPTLFSQSGTLITVASNTGPYATSAGPPTHWGVGTARGQIVLETAGTFAVSGTPINMIIGPPDGSGNYSSGNSSVVDGHFSRYIQGTGTFVITDSAITSATTITGVTFAFGTQPDTFLHGPPVSRVPAPSALLLLGSGLGLAAGVGWRRRRR
jgi:hypothetical protein